jgi:hypothetical protein
VAYQDLSTVTPCNTYLHERDFFRQERPSLSCTQELLGCGSASLGTTDITGALANSDVQAALKAAPILYGRDLRPVDGTVFRITVGGSKTIDVGTPCSTLQGCAAIPRGVAALVELLRALDEQELGRAPCSTIFETQ